ncbi:MAG: PIN domain-containing protein [Candidatus Sulfotelmatobacter sp.]
MRIALDSNILVYVEGVNGVERKRDAVEIVRRLPQSDIILPVQVLGELFHVLSRKARWSPERVKDAVLSWQDSFSLVETSPAVLLAATDLAVAHHIGIWDAVILAAAATSGCRLLLSEDLQDGFTWGGVTVVNPFAMKRHELLTEALGE